mmetsp:Transcript_10240/g.38796  ORF Transcript_10240/g.38796 Transcript_10240/m.38796 type:complete len:223 (-) Transcript_10240:327-995(-)
MLMPAVANGYQAGCRCDISRAVRALSVRSSAKYTSMRSAKPPMLRKSVAGSIPWKPRLFQLDDGVIRRSPSASGAEIESADSSGTSDCQSLKSKSVSLPSSCLQFSALLSRSMCSTSSTTGTLISPSRMGLCTQFSSLCCTKIGFGWMRPNSAKSCGVTNPKNSARANAPPCRGSWLYSSAVISSGPASASTPSKKACRPNRLRTKKALSKLPNRCFGGSGT